MKIQQRIPRTSSMTAFLSLLLVAVLVLQLPITVCGQDCHWRSGGNCGNECNRKCSAATIPLSGASCYNTKSCTPAFPADTIFCYQGCDATNRVCPTQFFTETALSNKHAPSDGSCQIPVCGVEAMKKVYEYGTYYIDGVGWGNTYRNGEMVTGRGDCSNHGLCRPDNAWGFTCTCDAGYTGTLCDLCASGFYSHYFFYYSLRVPICRPQPKCGKGQYISSASTTQEQTCQACPPSTYQPAALHRIEACIPQPDIDCGPGQYLPALQSKTARQQCMACHANTYQTSPVHKKTTCAVQTKCGKGQFISADSTTTARACSPCKTNTFQPASQHRIGTCAVQTKCGKGHFISPGSTTTARVCSPCNTNTFQPASQHQIERCIDQPKCGVGEFASTDSPESEDECRACPAYSYQNSSLHREPQCMPQDT